MKKIGILGGGQLGRMMIDPLQKFDITAGFLDSDPSSPCSFHRGFQIGDIKNFDDVLNFGKNFDIITVEIENVNTEALEVLENMGKKVFPTSKSLNIIKNKIVQKQFLTSHNIPTAPFIVTHHVSELDHLSTWFPAVHKLATEGYDGRGVRLLHTFDDRRSGFDKPSVLERKININKELAIIIARNSFGHTALYPVVEMHFNPDYNQLDYLFSPATVEGNIHQECKRLALKIVEEMNFIGLLAIEFFLDHENNLWVNEMAPRPHNSGHHTIEACTISQFEMLIRTISDLPIADQKLNNAALMFNIVGANGFEGPVFYDHVEEILKDTSANLHLYGKNKTKPGRKMGHITLIGSDTYTLKRKFEQIHQIINVISK